MSDTAVEIASQPACWRQAAAIAPEFDSALPRRAERVAVIGCGTSSSWRAHTQAYVSP